jgi:hypothetical protein
MGVERGEKGRDALDQAVVDDAFVLERLDLVPALLALHMDLVLLGADEGSLVDIWMDLDVRVVAELERILKHTWLASCVDGRQMRAAVCGVASYPFAVVDRHCACLRLAVLCSVWSVVDGNGSQQV